MPAATAAATVAATEEQVAALIAEAVAKVHADSRAEAFRAWVPPYPVWLAIGLYAMAFWILYVLSPEKGHEPSELFKTLAGAVVLTAFVNGVVASVFASNRDSQKKNDTIAAQAATIAAQQQTAPSAGA